MAKLMTASEEQAMFDACVAINADAPYMQINNESWFAGFQRRFIFELTKWANCPPSDNLWLIRIVPHNDGKGSYKNPNNTLLDLYNNIKEVNYQWKIADKWGVNDTTYTNGTNEGITETFLAQFDESRR